MKKRKATRRPSKVTADVVEARSVVLVDDNGKCRASLSCSGGDVGVFTKLQIYDDAGRPRVQVQVDCNGNPSVRLSTLNDGGGVSFAVNDGLGSGLSVGDHEGRPLIILSIPHPNSNHPNGTRPDITVLDETSNRGWSAFNGAYSIHPRSDE